MVWSYLNLAAMIVGYITIALVLLVIMAFIALFIREKINMRRRREELEKQIPAAEAKPEEKPNESAEDAEKSNVKISIK